LERQHSFPLLLHLSSGAAEPLKPVAQQGGGCGRVNQVERAVAAVHLSCDALSPIDKLLMLNACLRDAGGLSAMSDIAPLPPIPPNITATQLPTAGMVNSSGAEKDYMRAVYSFGNSLLYCSLLCASPHFAVAGNPDEPPLGTVGVKVATGCVWRAVPCADTMPSSCAFLLIWSWNQVQYSALIVCWTLCATKPREDGPSTNPLGPYFIHCCPSFFSVVLSTT
jgi:hypothetical protein